MIGVAWLYDWQHKLRSGQRPNGTQAHPLLDSLSSTLQNGGRL
jgi:hypothetical protein